MPVTLITGCSTGFGLLTALEAARRGHDVIATMRNPSRATDLEKAAADEGFTVAVAALDVTDDESVTRCVRDALAAHGRIDVLVNNAGIGIEGTIEEISDAAAKEVFETNVFGVLRMVRAVLP